MSRHLVFWFCAGLLRWAAAGAAAPVPPGMFQCADPELEVTVWASSPMFFNPTNIDIDQQGRIWVAEGVNYRRHFDRRPEGDRIMVLEDTNHDGSADRSWVFVQEKFLRAPMGVAVIGRKVVVSMAPDLVVFTDNDGDAVFDAAKGDTREVLLTGFNGRNHDHSLHSVTVGPDGKWYFSVGNCGAVFTDRSGRTFRIGASSQDISWWPKDPEHPDRDPRSFGGQKSDDGRVYIGGFIARMNPDGTHVQILAHNLRNSYENCVTSFGDIFANDNDDQPASRTFAVLEGGNYGFASADGTRGWQADRRPGQDIRTATWRQQDPGVAPAGDVYGGGAPTGIVYYENGALGERWQGTLLSCDAARNVILGYRPQPEGAGWKLERFDFLTTNKEGRIIGTDFTGGDRSARADDTKTLFRPSDVAVGPDGALYVSDWFDARVGGHNDLDDSLAGTIYRVAPKGFRPRVPSYDFTTAAGALEALMSPAIHVRALGAQAARQFPGANTESRVNSLLESAPDLVQARFYWMAESIGSPGFRRAMGGRLSQGSPEATRRMTERYALASSFADGQYHHDPPRTTQWCAEQASRIPPGDRAALEAWGLECRGRESAVYDALLPALGAADPLKWPESFAALAWRLHPPQSVPAFASRALAPALTEKLRSDALTAIAFNDSAAAAEAMLDIASRSDGTLKSTALWWLLNRQDKLWKAHNVGAALKDRGLYDPNRITLTPIALPDPPAPGFGLADVLKLTGNAERGAVASQRCLICHRINQQGVEFGPEMTAWGRTQPTEVIVRSIIDPGAEIAHGFHGMEIQLTDGTSIHGMVITDGDPLIIQSQGGVTQTVPRGRIRAKKPLARSLMLSATELGMSAQDTADVAAFLRGKAAP